MTPETTPRRGRPLELLIEVPAVVVMFVMMLHITANALLRTYADRPIPNTLEIVQYWYLPIVAFLGFIAAQHRGQHIAADLLYERLPFVARRYVLCAVLAVTAVLCLGFAWFGLAEATHAFETRKTAGISSVPAWPTYFLVPLAFGSLTIQFAWAAVQAFRHPEAAPDAVGDPEEQMALEQMTADRREGR